MKKYIILLDKDLINHCGTDWTTIVHYKGYLYIVKSANSFLNSNPRAKFAYLLNDYTQNLCELSTIEFSQYIIKHCKKIA